MTGLRAAVNTRRDPQKGQALLEWLIVSVLALMAAVWAAGEFVRQAEQAAAQGHAQWLRTVGHAIEAVMAQHDAGTGVATHAFDGLRGNTISPIGPWLRRLQTGGWLPAALARQPSMPYEVGLLKLELPGVCDRDHCTQQVLLLAMPKAGGSVPNASDLMAVLKGKGLAVTDLAPGQLRGPTFDLPNPPVGRQRLPVGTVALLAWRHDHEPPYVRVNESRQVRLAGGVVLGQLTQGQGSCSPAGLVMLGPKGDLRVCRKGQWQSVEEPHDHLRACLPQTPEQAFRAAWFKYTGFGRLFDTGPNCDCAAGFAPIKVVGHRGRVGAVELRDGYLCQRL